MSTIGNIAGSDSISSSRTVINNNFANLNTDKFDASNVDTDTAMAANSDLKVPSQKAVKAYIDAIGGISALVPTGSVLPYAGAAAPSYFLLCDGSAVSRATYATLFAIIGTTFGVGNGTTTFNLPDLRGSVALGAGTRVRTFTFSASADVNTATDVITVASNEALVTGQAVALTGSALPTGLSATTYYVIRVTATTIKLASTLANAQKGTAVDITATGTGTATLTQTLTARTLGTTGGEESHAMTSTELLTHHHSTTYSSSAGAGQPTGSQGGGTAGPDTGDTGGNAAMNVMNPYTVLNHIIKI